MKRLNIPIAQFKDNLNEISPSFCAAKWQQVTLHLQHGHTHSCHHPRTHKIPLEELENNPSALHNTNYKKEQRKLMLEGVRPSECDYCWRIEDSDPNAFSDRIYKSYENWAEPHIDRIKSLPWDQDVVPSYLEVSFSSVCNFKCSYCSPQFSSKWMEEVERYGPYPTSDKFGNISWLKQSDAMPIPHKDYNPYVEAFWKWWPSIFDKLEHFRITGGEPLLTKDTFDVLDFLIENPNPNMDLSINSNMNPPDAVLDKFIEKIKIICSEGKVKNFKIFTSAEAYSDHAEYIRHGLNYGKWISNIRKILSSVPNCSFTVMSTYNLLSVPSYERFLQDILDIKLDYNTYDRKNSAILIDTPYLKYPFHQSIFLLPKEMRSKIEDQVTFFYKHLENGNWYKTANRGFYQWEAEKFKRIYNMILNYDDSSPQVLNGRKDFVRFVDEHDLRRGTNFLNTFPELKDFYLTIKENM